MFDLDMHCVVCLCGKSSLCHIKYCVFISDVHEAIESQVRHDAPLDIELAQLSKVVVVKLDGELLITNGRCYRFVVDQGEVRPGYIVPLNILGSIEQGRLGGISTTLLPGDDHSESVSRIVFSTGTSEDSFGNIKHITGNVLTK